MTHLIRYLDVYPPTGFPDRTWGSPLEDAVARRARSVTELYTEALEALPIPAPRSSMRIMLWEAPEPDPGKVTASVYVDPTRDGEIAAICLTEALTELTPRAQAQVVLDCVHGMLLRLADVRGWDSGDLEACRQHVEDSDFTYTWDSPWKVSPNRRLQARVRTRLPVGDGYGRIRIEVADRAGSVVATSDEAVAFCTSQGLRRSAKTLRWKDSDRIRVVPYAGLGDAHTGGRLKLVNKGGRWVSKVKEYVTVREPVSGSLAGLDVEIERAGVAATEQLPRMVVEGGGPTNDVPKKYSVELHRLLDLFEGPAGQEWWQEAGLRELAVRYCFDAERTIVRTRRTGKVLRAWIDRPVKTIRKPYADVAAADVQALVAAVRRRTGLPPHPALGPGRPHVAQR